MATILVLDDVPETVMLIQEILTSKGHAIAGFTEEEEAISYARTHPVDLALLDIKLKKMSGLEVLGELKRIDPSTKVMMLTGYPTVGTASEAAQLGADAYCVKPIEKQDLEEKVERLVRQ